MSTGAWTRGDPAGTHLQPDQGGGQQGASTLTQQYVTNVLNEASCPRTGTR